jgi:hypothetical protein
VRQSKNPGGIERPSDAWGLAKMLILKDKKIKKIEGEEKASQRIPASSTDLTPRHLRLDWQL